MPTFIRRTYIEPGATLPMDIRLPAGRLLGVTDGGGALPSLRIWQEVRLPHPAAEPDGWDRWQLWVLRHGQRAPETPVRLARSPRPRGDQIRHVWDWEGVIEFNHQPAVIYMLHLGPAEPPRSTAEVLAEAGAD